jgi:hypothetical protein
MCTAHFVDEVTKKKIAAYAATFREVTRSPFGSEDQIGMLNLIDADSRQAVVSRADASKVFDLCRLFCGYAQLDRGKRSRISDLDDAHAAGRRIG